VVCALGVRLAAAFAVQSWVSRTPGRLCLIAGDAEGYWGLAQALVQRGEFAIYDPPRQVLRMPGFPLWLAAGMRLFGERVLWHRVGLALVGTATCAMTALLARRLAGDRAGLVAGWLAALSPPLAGLSVLILSETLFALAIVVHLWCLAVVWERLADQPAAPEGDPPTSPTGTLLVAWGAGVTAGVATLIRPSWLPFLPLVAALLVVGLPWLERLRTGGARSGASVGFRLLVAGLMLAGLGATLAPWVMRNARVTGHPVVTTLWAGPSLYDGLNPQATGESDMQFIEDDGIYQRLSEYEADEYYRAAAREFVREHPSRAVELALVKLARYWNPIPNAAQFGHGAIRWMFALWSAPVFAASVWGLVRRWRDVRLWVLAAGPIVFLGGVHAVFIGSVRYRLPAEYPLLTLAALGLFDLGLENWGARFGGLTRWLWGATPANRETGRPSSTTSVSPGRG
jgi:hypothetical protein